MPKPKRFLEIRDLLSALPARPVPAEVWTMSADAFWPDSNVAAGRAMAARLGVDFRDVVAVMANESDCLPDPPHHGPARGLIQFEPQTLDNLGWNGRPDEFARKPVVDQLDFVERYYAPYARAGLLKGGIGPIYVATFLPALLPHAANALYVLCGSNGPLAWAYTANRNFDRDKKGYITVNDLVLAAKRAAAASPRAQAILAEVDRQEAPRADESAPAVALDAPANDVCAEGEDEAS